MLIALLFVTIIAIACVIYLLADSSVHPRPTYDNVASKQALQQAAPLPAEDITYKAAKGEFESVRRQIAGLEDVKYHSKYNDVAFKTYFSRFRYAIELIMLEKEMITFALLQWVVIGLVYYLWVQMLAWIPPEVWESAKHSDGASLADIVLILWSMVCVGIAAFPLSILSGAMAATHFLHRQGKRSTIAAALQITLARVWPLWIFTWVDGWITVNQILERLPKKNDRRTAAQKAMSELLYFAWKVATIGILPSLVTGHRVGTSCKQSIDLLTHKAKEVIALRLGYSFLCWLVAVPAYIGFVIFFCTHPAALGFMASDWAKDATVFKFYVLAGAPIVIAAGIVQMLLRPVYLISACDIFSDYLNEHQETVVLPQDPSAGRSALVAFLVLCAILAVVFLYRDQLGITHLLSIPYK